MTGPAPSLIPGLPLVLVSAWNESGGGFLHRLFDGHPELMVYPFELQLGTGALRDGFSDWFSAKYRWPELPQDLDAASPDGLFKAFMDQELKSTLAEPDTAKHRAYALDFGLDDARALFRAALAQTDRSGGRTRRAVVEAYVRAVFTAWTGRRASGRERFFLGHCPTVNLDADHFLHEMDGLAMIQVVRSPISGFADFRRRVPGMDPGRFAVKWSLVNALSVFWQGKYPDRVRTVFFEDLLADREAAMRGLCGFMGVDFEDVLLEPTFNGAPMARLYPFGGVPEVSAEHEAASCNELSTDVTTTLLRGTEAVIRMFPEHIQEAYLHHV